jgi:hypothetical protein
MSGDLNKGWEFNANLGTVTRRKEALGQGRLAAVNVSDDQYWHDLYAAKEQNDFEEWGNYYGE